MGLLVLLTMGGALGWLVAVIVTEADREMIYTDIAAGAFGAALIGMIVGTGSATASLDPITLLFAIIGALGKIAIVNIIRRTIIRN